MVGRGGCRAQGLPDAGGRGLQDSAMSGPRSPSRNGRRSESLWFLGAILWPFATAAVAINLFLLGLIFRSAGWDNIAPVTALWASLPLGLPATWAAARWARSLIRQAEDEGGRG